MSERIQAIFENGILRPLQLPNLPENSIVEIDVHEITGETADKDQRLKEFD